ncbi:hypothetical protein KY332_03185 [Candidatus Woesearchaeota archaeon]|nr:hypothetical protein [Candidatus Woesearchaeota archaeon]
MQKRGQITVKYVSELVFGIAVSVIIIIIAVAAGTGEIYQKIRLSNENILSINTLNSVPDNANIFYKENSSAYSYKISGNSLETFKTMDDPLLVKRYFIRTVQQDFDESFKNPTNINLGKSGNIIKIEQDSIPVLDKQRCPSIELLHVQTKISPQTKDGALYEFTNAIASRLNAETTDTITAGTEQALEIIPSTEQNSATAYINPNLESKKRACLILNNLLNFYPDLETTIVVSDKLENAKTGVSLALPAALETSATISAVTEAFEAS